MEKKMKTTVSNRDMNTPHKKDKSTAPYGQLLIEEHAGAGHHTIHREAKPFRGYTLEEIRYRRVVNRMKIEIAQDKLRMLVSPQVKKDVGNVRSTVNFFQTMMRYVDIALVAYNVSRRVSTFFRRFSRRR